MTETPKALGVKRWTATEMLHIWAEGQLDRLEHPVSEVRRLSGMRGQKARAELITATVTAYVQETPGFDVAREALVHRYVYSESLMLVESLKPLPFDCGEDFARAWYEDAREVSGFAIRGHGETLLRALLERDWVDLLYIPQARIASIVEYRFWWTLQLRIEQEPLSGSLAAAFAMIDRLWTVIQAMSGPVTDSEIKQLELIESIRKAAKRGEKRQVRALTARLFALQGRKEPKPKIEVAPSLLGVILSIRLAQLTDEHDEVRRLFETLKSLREGVKYCA